MTLESAEIRLTQEAMLVDGLTVRDRTVVDYYASMPEHKRVGAAHDAMVVGSRALAAAGGSATMAALDDRLQSAVRGARETLTAMPDAISAQIARICERYFTENGEFDNRLGARLEAVGTSLASDGPVVSRMCEKVSTEIRRRVADALAPLSQALNVNDAGGPLGLIARSLQDVQAQQAEVVGLLRSTMKLREQRDLSVQKGYDFEDFVEETLGQLASRLGDRFENCSRVGGTLGGCKKGDFVGFVDPGLTRGATVGIALEAKNRKTATVVSLCGELGQAIANRDAIVGIGVLTNPHLSSAPIAFYGPDKLIVHLPDFGTAQANAAQQRQLIELAYYVARMQAVTLASCAPADAFDLAFVDEQLQRLDMSLRKFSIVKRSLTAVETAVAHARENLQTLEGDFAAITEELRARVERQTAALSTGHERALSA